MLWLRNTHSCVYELPHLRDASNSVLRWGPAGTGPQWASVHPGVLADPHVARMLEMRTVVPDPAYDADRTGRLLADVIGLYEAAFGGAVPVAGPPKAAPTPPDAKEPEQKVPEAASAAPVEPSASASSPAPEETPAAAPAVAVEVAAETPAETPAEPTSEPTPEPAPEPVAEPAPTKRKR